jgi:hypothetical protein
MKVRDIANARAGDKGTVLSIAVIARDMKDYPRLVQGVTAERVRAAFAPLGATGVTRYEAPGLGALNFVLEGVLGGGVSVSLSTDPHGKSLSYVLLAMDV